jgi:hypothetical protein
VPTTAIGAAPVGRTLEAQLRPVTDRLTGHLLEGCGHIVPLDRPRELLAILGNVCSTSKVSPIKG